MKYVNVYSKQRFHVEGEVNEKVTNDYQLQIVKNNLEIENQKSLSRDNNQSFNSMSTGLFRTNSVILISLSISASLIYVYIRSRK